MRISAEHDRETRTCVLHIKGEIDTSTSNMLRDELTTAFGKGCINVVLDLAGVDYADSSALSLIVWADRMLDPKGGRLVLAGATPMVERVLTLSGLVGAAPVVSAASNAADAIAGLALSTSSEAPLWVRDIVVPADPAELSAVRNRVCQLLEPLDIAETDVFDIKVAIGEALSNAVRHGSPGGFDDMVSVTVEAHEDRVVVVVSDHGAGFSGEAACDADPYAPSGRGVLFMRALMDRVEFGAGPDGGTCVTLVKHVTRSPRPV